MVMAVGSNGNQAERTVQTYPDGNLADFRNARSGMGRAEMEAAIQQALFLFDFLYVHLPLKQSMHSVDPVQALKLLLLRLDDLRTEYDFHRAMIDIFVSVRDLHTNYLLPEPFRSWVAVLPFAVQEYFEGDRPRYVVTQVWPNVQAPPFGPGVEVTHWNGIPMATAVDQNAAVNAGSNQAARHLQGLRNMTVRPLMITPMPAEDWVTLTFVSRGQVSEIRFPWKLMPASRPPNAVDPNNRALAAARSLGIDLQGQLASQALRQVLTPASVAREVEMMSAFAPGAALESGAATTEAGENVTAYPVELSYQVMQTPSGPFGYLRIHSFDVVDPDRFLAEVVRILSLLPQHGLILDVRSNPGGNILAGERLLQLFTNKRITPAPLQLRNTVQTMVYAEQEFLREFQSSIRLSVATGEIFSQPFPISNPDEVNQVGRRYPGKVVLLTDAACYSTTCFFAAGFQDHQIGPILGQHQTTGAGGANVWTRTLLGQFWPRPGANPMVQLPRGMDMRAAFRRSLRVGPMAGVPLEDLGVRADMVVRPTRNDIFNGDVDLFARAGEVLTRLIREG